MPLFPSGAISTASFADSERLFPAEVIVNENAWRYSDRVNRAPEAAKYTRDMSAHAAATTNPARVALILDDFTASMRG